MKGFWFVFVAIMVFGHSANAEFVRSERPTFDFATGGQRDNYHWLLTGTVPLNVIDGYVGVQWMRSHSSAEQFHNHLKARFEGGHLWDRFGLRGYVRYGQQSVMLQESLWHCGGNIEVYLYEDQDWSIHVGVGTWGEKETLLKEYRIFLPPGADGIDFGPRSHFRIGWRQASVLGEYLPTHDFGKYTVRVLPTFEVPVFKLFFFEQFMLVFTGGIEYQSETKHIEIESLQWHWTHAFRWKF